MWLVALKFNLMFWTIVTFAVLLVVLWKFVWKPILKGLDERADKIQGDLDRADRIREEAEKKLEDYNRQIAKAKQEVDKIFQEGKKEAEEVKAKIVKSAEKEASDITERTKNDIEQARKKALDDLQIHIADLVVFASKKLVIETIGTDDHKKLIKEALDQYEQSQIETGRSH